MSRISNWLTGTTRIAGFLDADRAMNMGAHIQAKPETITVTRRGAASFTLTVRIEPLGGSSFTTERRGDVAEVGRTQVGIFGYKDHPTEADTDIQRADRFNLEGQVYEVVAIWPGINGHLMAVANASA